MNRIAVCFVLAFIAAQSASAADNGVYLGVGVSQAAVDVDYGSGSSAIPIHGNDTKFKGIVGVRPLDWLAFEVNYVDFGKFSTPTAEYKLKGFDAFAMGLWEIAVVDFYAKAGIVRWNSKLDSLNASFVNRDDNGNDLVYGGGIQVHLGSAALRAEYEKFDIENTKTDLVSVAFTWTFL